MFDSGAGSRTYGGLGKERKGSGHVRDAWGPFHGVAWRAVDTRDEMGVMVWHKAWGRFFGASCVTASGVGSCGWGKMGRECVVAGRDECM